MLNTFIDDMDKIRYIFDNRDKSEYGIMKPVLSIKLTSYHFATSRIYSFMAMRPPNARSKDRL